MELFNKKSGLFPALAEGLARGWTFIHVFIFSIDEWLPVTCSVPSPVLGSGIQDR